MLFVERESRKSPVIWSGASDAFLWIKKRAGIPVIATYVSTSVPSTIKYHKKLTLNRGRGCVLPLPCGADYEMYMSASILIWSQRNVPFDQE